MKTIRLTKGKSAIVDDADYVGLMKNHWCFSTGYAMRGTWRDHKTHLMHRQIMGQPPQGMEIDHINGNRLDNRRCNLRFATRSQNIINKGCQPNNKLGVKGVSKRASTGRFYARIGAKGRKPYLGIFPTIEEAIAARQKAEHNLYGEFAYMAKH